MPDIHVISAGGAGAETLSVAGGASTNKILSRIRTGAAVDHDRLDPWSEAHEQALESCAVAVMGDAFHQFLIVIALTRARGRRDGIAHAQRAALVFGGLTSTVYGEKGRADHPEDPDPSALSGTAFGT